MPSRPIRWEAVLTRILKLRLQADTTGCESERECYSLCMNRERKVDHTENDRGASQANQWSGVVQG